MIMVEWLNQNAHLAYPLAESATRTPEHGLPLPDDVLVDLRVSVPDGLTDLYLSGLCVADAYTTLSICGFSAGLRVALFHLVRVRADMKPGVAYPLARVDGLLNAGGWVTFGPGAVTRRFRYSFAGPAEATLDTGAVRRVAPAPVTSIRKVGGAAGVALRGNVRVAAEGYMQVEADQDSAHNIVLSLDKQAAYGAFPGPCNEFSDTGRCGAPAIRSINGVCPDSNGVITLRFQP